MNDGCCIILAGGFGTRLRSLVPDKPKCLAPVGDTSFLQIQLRLLREQGIRRFILSLGYLAELVQQEVAAMGGDMEVCTVVEPAPLGTGGAIRFTMESAGIDEAIVTNGDTFLGGSLKDMLCPLDLEAEESARMAVLEVPDRQRFGGVQLRDAYVVGFSEKGEAGPGLINAGMYRVHQSVFDGVERGTPFSFETEVLPRLARNGLLTGIRIDGEFTDIGVPEDYLNFCQRHE